MTTITIPKKLARKDDLIVMPRREYESLLKRKVMQEFTLTAAQRKSLNRAMKNLRAGKTLSYDEFVRKLGFTD